MLLYNRVLQIAVGKPRAEALAVSELHCSFNIRKTSDSKENDISVAIYNMNPSTRALFETIGNRLVVSAGYMTTGPQLLAIGDILSASTDYTNPDFITTINAADAGKALRTARVSVSYKAGTPAKTMVQELLDKLDIDQPEFPLALTDTFKTGWSFVGKARDGLDQLAKRFGFEWSVQNNTLQLTEAREPSQRQAVYLSQETGMIGTPSPLTDTRKDDEKAKKPEAPGVKVTSLLNPAIIPGDPIVIDSRHLGKKTYRIKEVTHSGDNRGAEWTSTAECIEVNQ